jgi:SAM-dependent methyltransferase
VLAETDGNRVTSLRKSVHKNWRRISRTLRGIPHVGAVDFGDLRRTSPISRDFGTDRGLPIDRYYIEGFLERNAADVRGAVLEVGDSTYTRRYGGDRVQSSDIWHVDTSNPRASIVGDLANPPPLAPAAFDCVVLTQTLQFIEDPAAALRTVHFLLRPGGVLLLTVPCLTPVVPWSQWGPRWYWGFTAVGVDRLLGEVFGAAQSISTVHGNVLAAIAFLHGLAAQELTPAELDVVDSDYQVVIAARARKKEAPS